MHSANSIYKEITIPPFLNPQSIGDLNKQIATAEKENVRFVVLKGTETIFCNGLDLKWVTNNQQQNNLKEMQEYGAFLKSLQTGKFISIAIVKGSASGGGMGIVCACDYVIAETQSTFSLPEGLLGLIPGMILPSLLNRLTTQQIKKMVFTGQKYSSEIAYEWSIVDEVIANEQIATALSRAISTMKSCKQQSVEDMKQLLYNSTINKDELALKGMQILSDRLKEEEIIERLTNLSEFMEE